jgi:hypothetical protein
MIALPMPPQAPPPTIDLTDAELWDAIKALRDRSTEATRVEHRVLMTEMMRRDRRKQQEIRA